jgi:hypothetical protein
MAEFVIGALGTLFVLLVLGMMSFGPQILEWIEGSPLGTA